MLDTSYDYGCHLSKRFHGLASDGRYGFNMKPDAWSEFITGHRFVTNNCLIDLVQKQMDIDAYSMELRHLERTDQVLRH